MHVTGQSNSLNPILKFNYVYEQAQAGLVSCIDTNPFPHWQVSRPDDQTPLNFVLGVHEAAMNAKVKRIARVLVNEARAEVAKGMLEEPQRGELNTRFETFERWLPDPVRESVDVLPEGVTRTSAAIHEARDEIDSPTMKQLWLNSVWAPISGIGMGSVFGVVLFGGLAIAASVVLGVSTVGIYFGALAVAGALAAGIGVAAFAIHYGVQRAKYNTRMQELERFAGLDESALHNQWLQMPTVAKIVCLTSMGKEFRDAVKAENPELIAFCQQIDAMDLPPEVGELLDVLQYCPQNWDFSDTLDYLYKKDQLAFGAYRLRGEAPPWFQAHMDACQQRNS